MWIFFHLNLSSEKSFQHFLNFWIFESWVESPGYWISFINDNNNNYWIIFLTSWFNSRWIQLNWLKILNKVCLKFFHRHKSKWILIINHQFIWKLVSRVNIDIIICSTSGLCIDLKIRTKYTKLILPKLLNHNKNWSNWKILT